MEELQKVIKSICDDFADINAILAARSRELDRRELFDKEIETEIKNIKKNQNLQRESEEYKKSMLYYSEEKKKIESKFDNFKNLVKSLVVLVD